MWRTREAVLAVACLVIGSVGQLVQYLVSPLGSPEDPVASNVAKAAANPSAMSLATWLDLSILFFLPALFFVAALAGARTSRLAWTAGTIAVGTTIPGIAYVLAPDVLYAQAAHGAAVPATAIQAYLDAPVVAVATLVFLAGHIVGLILLGAALWRAGSVPRWAAVALALSPLLEIGGAAAGSRPVVVVAYLCLIGAFGACAAALWGSRTDVSPAAAPPVFAHS
jgi:hypothetical protein